MLSDQLLQAPFEAPLMGAQGTQVWDAHAPNIVAAGSQLNASI